MRDPAVPRRRRGDTSRHQHARGRARGRRRPGSCTSTKTPSSWRARALLTSPAEGAITYLEADLRRPDDILAGARHALDFSQPIALMMLMVLHMIPDAAKPHHIVARLVGALPGGSYLALSHAPSDILPESAAHVQQLLNAHLGGGASMTARSHDEVARFCDGMEIIPPGVVQVHQWRPADDAHSGGPASIWCAVARKPRGDVPLPS